MPDEPEEGFVVRDRRRFVSDAPAAPTPPPAPLAPAPPVEEEMAGDDTPIDAAQFAAFMNQMAQQQALEAGSDDEDMSQGAYGGEEGDSTVPDIYSVLVMFLNEMRTHSLLRLGLIPNPVTGQSEQDMQQARVAIDTLGFLVTQLEPVVAPEERLPLRAMVSDLHLQFARQSQSAQ